MAPTKAERRKSKNTRPAVASSSQGKKATKTTKTLLRSDGHDPRRGPNKPLQRSDGADPRRGPNQVAESKENQKPPQPPAKPSHLYLAWKSSAFLRLNVRLLTFAVFAYLCVNIRLFAVRTYGMVIHEFDPWFNFRATQYYAEHGWEAFSTWFDTQR